MQPNPSRSSHGRERGYALLTLMLFVALLAIAAAAVAPTIAFQLKRDREEEMIHRGVQYSRAVRRYFKKFGRYPTRVEDLEGANNMRFLRKRYKDPITGKDFKLLHLGEVKINFQGGIPGAMPPGGNAGGPAARPFGAPGGLGLVGTPQGGPQGVAQPINSQPSKSGDDESAPGQGSGAQPSPSQSKEEGDSGTPDKLSGQVFGGGPIVGVVSTSKDSTIRVFNDQKHYNEWQFIYDPSLDRGGLLNTPGQKAIGLQSHQPGAQGGQGMQGTQGAPPGQPVPQPPGSPSPEPDNGPD